MAVQRETAFPGRGAATRPRGLQRLEGHYSELTNPAAVEVFDTQLGPSDDVHAAQVLGQLISAEIAIIGSESSHPYNPFTGSNSNSVVYTELKSVGVNVPIFSTNLPFLGTVAVLNYQVNGQTQLFAGWGQSLLP
jgi:hypothetical protein